MKFMNTVVLTFIVCVSNLIAQENFRFEGTQVGRTAYEEDLGSIFKDYKLFRINGDKLDRFLTNDYSMKRADYREKLFTLALEGLDDRLLNIHSYDLLAEDYRIIEGERMVRSPQKFCRTYRGVSGEYRVAWTVTEQGFVAYLKGKKESYYIEPLVKYDDRAPKDVYVYYRGNDVVDQGHACGVHTTHHGTHRMKKRLNIQKSMANTPSGCINIRLSVAALLDMHNEHGTNLNSYIQSIINNVNTDYDTDFVNKVEFEIVETVVATDAGHSLESVAPVDTASVILNNFANWAPTGFSATHDLGTLFTKRNILADDGHPGVVGLAYLNVLCNNATAKYSLIEDFSTNASFMRQVVTHEIGHNFGCGHDASGSPYIMAPAVNGSTTWSAETTGVVNNKLNSSACNSGTGELQGSATADFNLPETLCVGYISLTGFESRGTTTYSWNLQDGDPATSTSQSVNSFLSGTGLKTITLTADNGYNCGNASSSVTISKQININPGAVAASSCNTDYKSNMGQGGWYNCSPTNVTFNTINRNSPAVNQDQLVLDDQSCLVSTTVELGDVVALSVTKGTTNSVATRVWIDYNNDGILTSTEIVMDISADQVSVHTSSVTIPSEGVVLNTPLRMRVLTDVQERTACEKPLLGQVEDYAVIVEPKTCTPVALSTSTNGTTSSTCDATNGWTYYQNAANDYFFAINWGTGNDAAKAAATVTVTKDNNVYGETSSNEATYTMSRYWNVDIGSASIVNPVSARFYYDAAEKTAVDNAANAFANGNPNATYETGTWFKTNTGAFVPATNVTPSTIEGVTGYTVTTGTENGVAYAQYNNLNSFSGGTYGAGAGNSESVLPVVLKSFDVRTEESCNTIVWETASEVNTEYIELLGSVDGERWSIVTTKSARGGEHKGARYAAKDCDVSLLKYYRLNTVDYDGFEELSHIVVAKREDTKERSLYIEPNPTYSAISVSFNTTQEEQIHIGVYDLFGRQVRRTSMKSEIGINTKELSLEGLATGTYIVSVKGNNYLKTKKVIKL